MKMMVKASTLEVRQLKVTKKSLIEFEFDNSTAPENTPFERDIDNSWSPWPNKIVSSSFNLICYLISYDSVVCLMLWTA